MPLHPNLFLSVSIRTSNQLLTHSRTLLFKPFVMPATPLHMKNHPMPPESEPLTSMVKSASKRISNSENKVEPEKDHRVLQKS